MTIKYNVSGAKARNGKEILPMAFGDRAEAERFAKYHEGLSVPQNLRKRPGIVVATETFSGKGHPQNIPKYGTGLKNHPVSAQAAALKGTCIDGKEHGPWADNYTYCTTCGFYDFDKFKPTAEQTEAAEKFFASSSESATAQAVLSALIKSGDEFVMHYPNCQMIGRVHRRNFEEDGVERKSPPVTIVVDPKVFMAGVEEHTGPVQVLKLPIVLGGVRPLEQSTTVGNPNTDLEEAYAMGFRAARSIDPDDFEETQDYVDQRRSDLKELVSYDRSI